MRIFFWTRRLFTLETDHNPRPRHILIPLASAAILGLVLAVIQFVINKSLWLDEAALAINILTRDFGDLLNPLDNRQMAPIGFLLIERFFTLVFGNNDHALRIFPLLSFIASAYLIFRLSILLIKRTDAALLATAIFTLSGQMLYFATEVKQYMPEVMASLLMIFLIAQKLKTGKPSHLILAISGIATLLVSHTVTIVIFCAGAYYILRAIRMKREYHTVLPFIAIGAAFIAYYLAFLNQHPAQQFMTGFWNEAFMPRNVFSAEWLHFIFQTAIIVSKNIIQNPAAAVIVPFIILGGLARILTQRDFTAAWLLCAPILLHLILSALHLYPVWGRFVLYATPLLMILAAAGLTFAVDRIAKKSPRPQLAAVWIMTIGLIVSGISALPIEREEILEGIRYIEKKRQPAEQVYVYTGAVLSARYYALTGKVSFTHALIEGGSHRDDPIRYTEELNSVQAPFWVLFTHNYKTDKTDDQKQTITHLESTGHITDRLIFTGGFVARVER